MVFLSKGHTNWLSGEIESTLKAYIIITLYRLARLYLGTHTVMQYYLVKKEAMYLRKRGDVCMEGYEK